MMYFPVASTTGTPAGTDRPPSSPLQTPLMTPSWMRMRASLVGAAPVPSIRVPPLTNIVWASACGPGPARVTAATAASVFSGVVFLRAIGLITLFSWVHLGHTLSRPPLPPHFAGSCDAGYRPIILLEPAEAGHRYRSTRTPIRQGPSGYLVSGAHRAALFLAASLDRRPQ